MGGTQLPPSNPSGGAPPTHVHKYGCGWTKDCYAIGSWEDGRNDSEPGVWTTSLSSPEDGLFEHGIYCEIIVATY